MTEQRKQTQIERDGITLYRIAKRDGDKVVYYLKPGELVRPDQAYFWADEWFDWYFWFRVSGDGEFGDGWQKSDKFKAVKNSEMHAENEMRLECVSFFNKQESERKQEFDNRQKLAADAAVELDFKHPGIKPDDPGYEDDIMFDNYRSALLLWEYGSKEYYARVKTHFANLPDEFEILAIDAYRFAHYLRGYDLFTPKLPSSLVLIDYHEANIGWLTTLEIVSEVPARNGQIEMGFSLTAKKRSDGLEIDIRQYVILRGDLVSREHVDYDYTITKSTPERDYEVGLQLRYEMSKDKRSGEYLPVAKINWSSIGLSGLSIAQTYIDLLQIALDIGKTWQASMQPIIVTIEPLTVAD